jgi:hypothetical protein
MDEPECWALEAHLKRKPGRFTFRRVVDSHEEAVELMDRLREKIGGLHFFVWCLNEPLLPGTGRRAG